MTEYRTECWNGLKGQSFVLLSLLNKEAKRIDDLTLKKHFSFIQQVWLQSVFAASGITFRYLKRVIAKYLGNWTLYLLLIILHWLHAAEQRPKQNKRPRKLGKAYTSFHIWIMELLLYRHSFGSSTHVTLTRIASFFSILNEAILLSMATWKLSENIWTIRNLTRSKTLRVGVETSFVSFHCLYGTRSLNSFSCSPTFQSKEIIDDSALEELRSFSNEEICEKSSSFQHHHYRGQISTWRGKPYNKSP